VAIDVRFYRLFSDFCEHFVSTKECQEDFKITCRWGYLSPSRILMVGFYPAGRERQKGNEAPTAWFRALAARAEGKFSDMPLLRTA